MDNQDLLATVTLAETLEARLSVLKEKQGLEEGLTLAEVRQVLAIADQALAALRALAAAQE